jgi:hypothetical protein
MRPDVSISRNSIVTLSLAAFTALALAAAVAPAANATKVTTAPPPKDTSNCLKVLGRNGNYLVCGDTIHVLPSLLKRKPKA